MSGERDEKESRKDAYARALRQLVRREHSREELRQWLAQRGYAVAVIDTVLGQLLEDGSQSDARFAEMFVRSRAGRGYGPLRIRAELDSHRIDRDLVEAAFASEAADWEARAGGQLARHFGDTPAGDFASRAKYHRYLLRRGFDGATVGKAIRALTSR